MSSASSNDGSSTITITFKVGYPLNIAAVDVQNRVSQAASSLPAIVNQGGVTIKKQNPNFVLIVNLTSPDDSVDPVTLSNYAYLQIVDPVEAPAGRRRRADLRRAPLFDARLARSGQARQSRRHRGRRPERDRRAERSGRGGQDRPVAGARRARRSKCRSTPSAGSATRRNSATSSCAPTRRAAPSCACATSRGSNSARCNIRRRPFSAKIRPSCWRSSRCRAPTRSTCRSRSRRRWRSFRKRFPPGNRLRDALRHDALRVGGDARRA